MAKVMIGGKHTQEGLMVKGKAYGSRMVDFTEYVLSSYLRVIRVAY